MQLACLQWKHSAADKHDCSGGGSHGHWLAVVVVLVARVAGWCCVLYHADHMCGVVLALYMRMTMTACTVINRLAVIVRMPHQRLPPCRHQQHACFTHILS